MHLCVASNIHLASRISNKRGHPKTCTKTDSTNPRPTLRSFPAHPECKSHMDSAQHHNHKVVPQASRPPQTASATPTVKETGRRRPHTTLRKPVLRQQIHIVHTGRIPRMHLNAIPTPHTQIAPSRSSQDPPATSTTQSPDSHAIIVQLSRYKAHFVSQDNIHGQTYHQVQSDHECDAT